MSQVSDRRRWLVVGLVFIAIVLNYVDRQILALLKPTLQAEFHWSDRDYSHMASAFQFAAAIAFLGTGWFIDKVGLRPGFALGVGVWSLAGMAHAFVSSVAGFVGVRAVLGVAESIGTPAAVKTAATYFEPRERSIALGLGGIAPNVGAILTPLLIPLMALMMGWKATFLIAGGLGLVWVVVWLAVRLPEQPQSDADAPAMAWSALLTDRRQWAIILGKALTDQVWWFLLFFLPDLFHRVFGLDQSALGLPVALVYAMAAVGGITAGFLPAALMGRGWSVNAARKVTMLIYAVMVLPVPLLIQAQSPWLAAFIVGVALFAHQGFSTSLFGLTTDVFPARVVGSAIGIGAFAGNLSGMAMIEFTGWSLDAGHGYLPMLLICAVTYLAALGVIHLLLPRFTAIGGEQDGGSPVLAH
ncbi:MAG: MFS transporter [Novosphingobium sp. SCN 66-18]|nr:MAG: MFS transporter [Novosphingobium sp. SCN 66-18]